jgi:hypothetical protein
MIIFRQFDIFFEFLELAMTYILVAVAVIFVGIGYFSTPRKQALIRLPVRTQVIRRRKI